MKKLALITSLALVAALGTGFAATVHVDLTNDSLLDITDPNFLTRDGVTFQYQDPLGLGIFGQIGTISGLGTITGDLGGDLVMDFNDLNPAPVIPDIIQGYLQFYWELDFLTGPLTTSSDQLFISPSLAGSATSGWVMTGGNFVSGVASGTVTVRGPFDRIDVWLPGQDVQSAPVGFLISNVIYGTEETDQPPVPEPGTFVLLGLGLAGLGVRKFRRAA